MSNVKLSVVLSALSYALDLTEGQPLGHAGRSCLIGMRMAEELGLSASERSDLFYALLMKDAGCSSTAARIYQLFGGDDQAVKHALWTQDWRSWRQKAAFGLEWIEPGGRPLKRLRKFVGMAIWGTRREHELFAIRCDRGADIARRLGMSEATSLAIRAMDEHWDGGGHPDGLRRDAIPLGARIVGLAQVAEIFSAIGGPAAALEVAQGRRGRWFDPELVRVLRSIGTGDRVWTDLRAENLPEVIAAAEPTDKAIPADESRLDQIAHAFALVVDAKSNFTYHHSERMATVAEAIAGEMGLPEARRVRIRRAGLLHDIGKLSVPNRILDKAGPLEAAEWDIVRRHPYYTFEILKRVPAFSEFAVDAASHHERMDGKGYYRGIGGAEFPLDARILATADVYDALSAARPYRGALPIQKVLSIIGEGRGTQLCPDTIDALYALTARSEVIASA